MYWSQGNANVNPSNYIVITKLQLPAGAFEINGKAILINQTGQTDVVACNMYADVFTHLDTTDATLLAPSIIKDFSYATIPLLGTVDLAKAGQVRVECISTAVPASPPGVHVAVKLVAQEVGEVVKQSP